MHGGRPDQLKDTLIELQEIESKAAKIIEKLPVFSFDSFKKRLLNHVEGGSLASAFKSMSKHLRASGQIGDAINYECAQKSLSKFKPGLLLTDITFEFLNECEAWMKEKNRSITIDHK